MKMTPWIQLREILLFLLIWPRLSVSEKSNKGSGCFLVLVILIILIVGSFFGGQIRVDHGHRDVAPSGAKIRLAISEKECQQYPNRYYFRNLCILCPDEQPLVDGHCHRCPAGQLVLSNGCRDCDSDWNYITPKAECDACPNRVYENGLCKLAYHTERKWCGDDMPWRGTKEECDACEHRRYRDGLCESYYDGWLIVDYPEHMGQNRKDLYYEDNKHLMTRFYDKNKHVFLDEYYEYRDYNEETHDWDIQSVFKYVTYFPTGQVRTEKDPAFMKGYYQDGTLAFERDDNEAVLYTPAGDILARIRLVKNRPYQKTDYNIVQAEVYTEEKGLQEMTEAELYDYLQTHYPVEFELPFGFQIGDTYQIMNEGAEKPFERHF